MIGTKGKGPIASMYNSCIEYGLLEYVMISIQTGSYISNAEWKTKIKGIIWNREKCTYIANSIVYTNLVMYKHCISPGVVWPWWTFTKRHPSLVTTCRTMLRLLTGNHEIAERLRRNGTSRTCHQCTMMVTDSIPYMLFECASGSQLRRNLWSDVIINSPKVLADKMSEMNFRERSNFLLSGFY